MGACMVEMVKRRDGGNSPSMGLEEWTQGWVCGEWGGDSNFCGVGRVRGSRIPDIPSGGRGMKVEKPSLWVLRPPDSRLADGRAAASVDWKAELLPEGYEKGGCVSGLESGWRGGGETGWAPQAAILAHEATGAFITHCGWNSALESVFAGVPMIALPLQSDQPGNALLLAREAKVAVEMKRSNGVAEKDGVERAVRYLVAAEKMKRRVKAVLEEGGAAWQNLDSFVEYFSEHK